MRQSWGRAKRFHLGVNISWRELFFTTFFDKLYRTTTDLPGATCHRRSLLKCIPFKSIENKKHVSQNSHSFCIKATGYAFSAACRGVLEHDTGPHIAPDEQLAPYTSVCDSKGLRVVSRLCDVRQRDHIIIITLREVWNMPRCQWAVGGWLRCRIVVREKESEQIVWSVLFFVVLIIVGFFVVVSTLSIWRHSNK